MIIRFYILKYFLLFILIQSCVFDAEEKIQPKIEFGFEIDNYKVSRDTIRPGDSFGEILINKKLSYPQIYKIVQTIKDSFDIRWLTAGKPYTILSTKDSLEQPLYFIYQPNKLNYVVIDFANFDSIVAYNKKKPFKIVRKTTYQFNSLRLIKLFHLMKMLIKYFIVVAQQKRL